MKMQNTFQTRTRTALAVGAFLAFTSGLVGAAEPPQFHVRFAAVSASESDPVVRVQVLRTGDTDRPVSVDFLTDPVSATPDSDYSPTTGTATFQPGELLRLIEIPILNDGLTELGETFRVVLRNPTEGAISTNAGAAIVTISDNDPGFTVDSRVVNVAEAAGEVIVGVRRGTDHPARISVDYALTAGTATAGFDYQPVSGTLAFDTHEAIQTIRIPILEDVAREPTEEFTLVLTNPSPGTSLGPAARASVRIADNDLGISFSPPTLQIREGAWEAHVGVSLEANPVGPASVSFTVVPVSASEGLDYQAVSGTVRFAAGEVWRAICIPILEDSLTEGNETFQVRLHDPDNAGVLGTPNVATVAILDDDVGFWLQVASNPVSETDGKAVLNVHRSSDAPRRLAVDYATEPDTATPGVDYTPVTGTLTFAAHEDSKRVEVPIHADSELEGSESFRVILSNPSAGQALGTPSTITIRIQENPNGFRFDNAIQSVWEGIGVAVLRVDRGTALEGIASVDYAVEPGLAVEGADYMTVRGTLGFSDGETDQFIEVPILNDGHRETTEGFKVVLRNPSPGTALGRPATAGVSIEDNDSGFTVGEFAVGSEQAGVVEVFVYPGSDGPEAVSVDYEVLAGTATPDLDYVPTTGTLFFKPGETDKPIRVPILDDALQEPPETFRVVLRNPSPGATLGTPKTTVARIEDDDQGFILECAASDPSCISPREDGGVADVAVVIAGDFSLTQEVSVEVLTIPRGARPDQDYASLWQRLTFAPGERRQTVSVPIINDTEIEAPEAFRVALRNAVGLRIGNPPSLEFTIQDNERGYWIEHSPGSSTFRVREGSPEVAVNIYRDGEFGFASSVSFRAFALEEPGSAKLGEDYLPVFGTVTFGPGETHKTVLLPIVEDGIVELPEPFLLELTNPTAGVAIYESQRLIEIQDNDLNPLRVDPDFRPAVRFQPVGAGGGGRGISFLPDGRMMLPTPLWRLTGEDGQGIVRLLVNGELDPTFGMVEVLGLGAMAVQASGEVLVGGGPDLRIHGADLGRLVRLNADGSLDEAFQARIPSSQRTVVTALAAQPDGKALVATSSISSGAVLRLEPDGTMDPNFQVVRIAESVERMVVDHAGRILVGGPRTGACGCG